MVNLELLMWHNMAQDGSNLTNKKKVDRPKRKVGQNYFFLRSLALFFEKCIPLTNFFFGGPKLLVALV